MIGVLLLLALVPGNAVRMKDEALAQGKYITLLDVVEGDGLSVSDKALFAKVYLGKSPAAEEEKRVTIGDVNEALAARGIERSRYVIVGDGTIVKTNGGEGADSSGLQRKYVEAIATEVARSRQVELQRVVVHLLQPIPEVTDIVSIANVREEQDWTFSLEVVKSNGTKVGDIKCSAEVVIKQAACVAARDLKSGEIVSSKDVVRTFVEPSEKMSKSVEGPQVIGARVIRKIAKGSVIARDAVKRTPIVHKRDVVVARSECLDTTAHALDEGAEGDIIALEYVSTKNKFKGKVLSSGLVEEVKEE